MRSYLLMLLTVLFTVCGSAQDSEVRYDPVLAEKLGNHKNGMKKYILAILRTGPGDTIKGQAREELFKGHMKNIGDLAGQGKLSLAGPFAKNGQQFRGLFILNVDNIEEARKLCDTDPTIRKKVFVVDLFEWYGSAGVQELNRIHKMITPPGD